MAPWMGSWMMVHRRRDGTRRSYQIIEYRTVVLYSALKVCEEDPLRSSPVDVYFSSYF